MSAFLSRIASFPQTAALLGVVRDPRGLFILLGITVLVLYGLSVGKTKALASLLSIYVAYVLTVLFPFLAVLTARVPVHLRTYSTVVLFILLYGVVFLLITGSMRRTRLTLGEISLPQVAVISIVQIGLLASIALSLVPSDISGHWVGSLSSFVLGGKALWAWAAASLLIMPFMRGRSRVE